MMADNALYFGDNLDILREHIRDETVDLVYLDPPFNSARSYNLLFKDQTGKHSEAQVMAFEDTWQWSHTAETQYTEILRYGAPRVIDTMTALRKIVGTNEMMAYLVMMTARLVELHRVLKPTGSLYLHCDPTASHYLKVILDSIFGAEQFKNEIIWKRTTAHGNTRQGARHWGRVSDTVLFYTKSTQYTWNQAYSEYREEYLQSKYAKMEPETGRRYQLDNLTGPGGAAKGNAYYEFLGVTRYWRYSKANMERLYREGRIVQTKPGAVPRFKRYLDEMPGQPLQSVWTDIEPINSQAKERLGYPTQKPLALLERIIAASSNPGDVILDPFCGCGTAVAAAQKLDRRWLGIDITFLSINIMMDRLGAMFELQKGRDYDVIGEPEDEHDARQLAEENPYQFQWWALSRVQAQPVGGEPGSNRGKKGKDRGIDGVRYFIDDSPNDPKRVIIQVKGGAIKSGDIRDLVGTVEREKAAIGAFVTLRPPTKEMMLEAVTAGYYTSKYSGADYPRIQVLTVGDLFSGKGLQLPSSDVTSRRAQREKGRQDAQLPLM